MFDFKFKPEEEVIYISWNDELSLYNVLKTKIDSVTIYADSHEYLLKGDIEIVDQDCIFSLDKATDFLDKYFRGE